MSSGRRRDGARRLDRADFECDDDRLHVAGVEAREGMPIVCMVERPLR